ncbi:hypothetical protein Lnau_0911 [Legionella nautarum]|uniref:Uncharacterized protein n=1 Tax=Legionella nautarum TaxID=45070 RepID=A0A0W0WUC8_9GAMM|nr:hypothetical protein [Legionella nautarum]KTD35927.1 hypothetical protein Lnau_0911 [Legionella nautarum]
MSAIQFKLTEQSSEPSSEKTCGQLIKINSNTKDTNLETVLEVLQTTIIGKNKNSLFIWTTPTTRLTSSYEDSIYPGHNFTSVTNEQGETVSFISKRPNTTNVLGEHKRVPDARFKNQSGKTKLFTPRFATIKEELEQWHKRSLVVDDYPLFVHIIPFHDKLDLDLETYKSNVNYLLGSQEPYTLFSFLHPSGNRYIRAANCNTTTEQSIFGLHSTSVQDLACQDAAMKLVMRLIKSKYSYLSAAENLGLTKEIEPSTIPEDLYYASFTC